MTTITRHYGLQTYTYNVYDYNDGIRLEELEDDCYVANVPCYNVREVSQIMFGDKHHGFSVQLKWRQMYGHKIDIVTDNHRGPKGQYVLATPEFIEFVEQQSIVGALKAYNIKVPKLHKKSVRLFNRGPHGHHGIFVDCYIEYKFTSSWLKNLLKEEKKAKKA